MGLRLIERLVCSVFLVLGCRELDLGVGQLRKRGGMIGLGLVKGGIGCRLGGSRVIQLGLGIGGNLLLIGNCLLGSLHLALDGSRLLLGGGKLALALRLRGLGGRQRLGRSSHLCLGVLVLRARSALLGSIQIGLGRVIARPCGVHVRICRGLCLLSCRKLDLRFPLLGSGGIGSRLGIREFGLRISGLLLCLLQITRSLLCGRLSGGYGLGRGVGCSSPCGLKRRLGIGGRLLRGNQGFVLVRQVLLGGIERSLSVLKRLDIQIGLVLRSAQLLFQPGRGSGNRAITCTAGRVIDALRPLLVGGSSIVGSSSRFQIGLGSSSFGTRRINCSLQVGDLLRRRHSTRASTGGRSARQRRHHRSRCARSANAIRTLRRRGQGRQQRAARHGNRRRSNCRHASSRLGLTQSLAVHVLVHVLAHCRFLPTVSRCLPQIVDLTCPIKKR